MNKDTEELIGYIAFAITLYLMTMFLVHVSLNIVVGSLGGEPIKFAGSCAIWSAICSMALLLRRSR